MRDSIRPEKILFMIAAIAIVLGAMRFASGVLVPGLLALFIAVVCTEPMYWMTAKGIPRWLAILVVVLLLLAVSSLLDKIDSELYQKRRNSHIQLHPAQSHFSQPCKNRDGLFFRFVRFDATTIRLEKF